MIRFKMWLVTYLAISMNLAVGAAIAYFVGWFFDSLMVALILLALWAIILAPSAWNSVVATRQMLDERSDPTE